VDGDRSAAGRGLGRGGVEAGAGDGEEADVDVGEPPGQPLAEGRVERSVALPSKGAWPVRAK